MNTNDEQASYGEQPKRGPLLSDEEFERMSPINDEYLVAEGFGKEVRDFYEAKIASGELMVVVTAKGTKLPPRDLMWGCEYCASEWTALDNKMEKDQPKQEPLSQMLPTEENLGFKYDLNDPHVDISSVSSELASSFALWFAEDVFNWHPEEIADAALRFGLASGELMVVKTAKGTRLPPRDLMWGCEHCARQWTRVDNFCPGCGAKIVE